MTNIKKVFLLRRSASDHRQTLHDESAETVLEQIDSQEYSLPFAADLRKIYKIGVSFDSRSRRLVVTVQRQSEHSAAEIAANRQGKPI